MNDMRSMSAAFNLVKIKYSYIEKLNYDGTTNGHFFYLIVIYIRN